MTTDTAVERTVDLTDPTRNRLHNLDLARARELVGSGSPAAISELDGSFAIVASEGTTVRLARSLDRPMRYFLAKQSDGPMLVVADRIDTIRDFLEREGLGSQFHPSYTRMVPAHHVVEIRLVGCPDPDPTYTRFFDPPRGVLPPDLDVIGHAYVEALAREIEKWLLAIPPREPIGVCFSGGIDSGAVFLVTLHVLRRLGMSPARLKAFTLAIGDGADLDQARRFLSATGMEMYLEPIEAMREELDPREAIRIVEDYKPLDVEAATMVVALCRGVRKRYPEWRWLADGDGGDENLKDYPIEANPELTIRSVLNNRRRAEEGWGVGTIKHSLTYSGGLSRAVTRTYAPLACFGFEGFSPFTRPAVVEVAEGIPFVALTGWKQESLYALKGDVVGRGVRAVTGVEMPIFPKRRFQEGALPAHAYAPQGSEHDYRREFLSIYV